MMEDTSPKPFVFVLMPFNSDFNDIYQLGIKAACENAGAYCERVDEQIYDEESILHRIYNQIAKADIIVADMTGQNPNVFYEVGYSHALNKRTILVTQIANDIPFDLKHRPHIVYGNSIALLKTELEKRVQWSIENPKESLSKVDLDLEFLVNGVRLIDQPSIEVRAVGRKPGIEYVIAFEISMHNRSNKSVLPGAFSLSLITPSWFYDFQGDVRSVSSLPEVTAVVNFTQNDIMFPDGLDTKRINFKLTTFELVQYEIPVRMLLRQFTELGPRDFPFSVILKPIISG